MAGVAANLERIVQTRRLFSSFQVDGNLLGLQAAGFIACQSRKVADVFVEVFGFEAGTLSACAVVQFNVLEIRDHEQVRHLIGLQMQHIVGQLFVGGSQVLARALHLNGDASGPEIVKVAFMPLVQLDLALKVTHGKGFLYAEHREKGGNETLCLCLFTACILPLLGKGESSFLHLFPGEGHGLLRNGGLFFSSLLLRQRFQRAGLAEQHIGAQIGKPDFPRVAPFISAPSPAQWAQAKGSNYTSKSAESALFWIKSRLGSTLSPMRVVKISSLCATSSMRT